MYSKQEVKNLVDDQVNVLYITNYRGELDYLGLSLSSLTSIINSIHDKAFKEGFVQGSSSDNEYEIY